ncbi:TetR/AcrR family transcriptional regulator [Actinokineospora guangxiensis]|uniref:TetR/AcrR family transcriptional regulator n=1 Tax=Actinokineospora guangxiensis TaxID=1490288 RepID=A0ABW0ETR0_9PSEU
MPEKAERRDPARTMSLLWRSPGEPARGRRPGLTADAVVAAGIELADEAGLAELSMRRVAERLGVGTMSLYTYVQNKADLVAAMRDQVVGEVAVPDRDGDWRVELTAYAHGLWDLMHRHPWLLGTPIAHELAGPNETVRMDAVLGIGAAAGLAESDMLGVYLLVDAYVRGLAWISVDTQQASARSGMTEVEWWADKEAIVNAYVTPARFPAMTAVAAAGAFAGDGFDFGLQRVLDGIAAHLDGQ